MRSSPRHIFWIAGGLWLLARSAAGETAEELLQRGAALLRQGKVPPAVQALRELVEGHKNSPQAAKARELLAGAGFGMEFQVKLEQRRQLLSFELPEPEIVPVIEKSLAELRPFFKQAFPEPRRIDLEVMVYDSRARFRGAEPRGSRRSAYAPRPPGPKGELRARIASYYDARIVNRRDILDVLHASLARELARALLRAHARRPLPESLEAGLVDYLSSRLFPQKLVSLAQTPEDFLKGAAREGLPRIEKVKDFKAHLRSAYPEGKAPARSLWQWSGFSYAVIDCLINGKLEGAAGGPKDGGAGKPGDPPRNAQLQAFLRDLDASPDSKDRKEAAEDPLPGIESLLLRHFGLTLDGLHAGLVPHILKYPPKHPDFEGLAD